MLKRILKLDWKGYYEYTWDNVQKYAPNKAEKEINLSRRLSALVL